MTKKLSQSQFISQKPNIIWLSFMVRMCKMIISPGFVFPFFPIFSRFWVFGLLRGVKGQKMVQNDKKLCLLHSISQEPYIIWLSFIVHIYKMIISLGVFFIFQNFDFLGFWSTDNRLGVGKRAKNGPEWQKFCLLHSISQVPYIIWLSFMVQMCKMIILQVFFFNFKILIF